MRLPDPLRENLDKVLGRRCIGASAITGGCIHSAARLECDDGTSFFVKWNDSDKGALIKAEVAGLNALRASGAVPTPEIIAFHEGDKEIPQFLVLELLQEGSKDKQSNRQLGELLANVHRCTNDSFGFDQDNYIGELEQINVFEKRWGTFYRRYRLEVQGDLGVKRGWLRGDLWDAFQSALPKIEQELNALAEPPALLHGDLWSGNVFWSVDGPILIDPAVYFGNREVDIAFMQFFNNFDPEVYSHYNKNLPLSDGYARRKDIYNLYHVMKYANMFGGSYPERLKATLADLRFSPHS